MPTRVLLVEDNTAEAILVTHLLAREAPGPYELTHVQTMRDAVGHLRNEATDCVLLDLTLPDATGSGTVQAVRDASPGVPIVVLSGVEDEQVAVASVRTGAQDFVTKGEATPRRLWQAMRYAVIRTETEQDLRHRASHDPLTGLANRALFEKQLKSALSAPPSTHGGLAVLFIDLDGFKLVNDTFGHQAGDDLLVVLAQRMRSALEDGHVVARHGGDEFLVLAQPVDGTEMAMALAGRLRTALAGPVRLQQQVVEVGASIGIAYTEDRSARPEALLWGADAAMYEAKVAGGHIALARPEQMERE